MNKVINSYTLQLMPNVIQRLKSPIEGKNDRHLIPLLSLLSSLGLLLAIEKSSLFLVFFFSNNQRILTVVLKCIRPSNSKLLSGKAWYHLKKNKII